MDVIKFLKRKDASSVVVGIALGLIVFNAVQTWALRPAQWLSGSNTSGGGWRAGFWMPLLLLLVELIVLEVAIRIYVFLAANVKFQSK